MPIDRGLSTKRRRLVYLLTFGDGMQYVGSATGQGGFWQRWQDYLRTGNGGNQVLKRDDRDARTATVSILKSLNQSPSMPTYSRPIASMPQ
jgi:hypothetical protein